MSISLFELRVIWVVNFECVSKEVYEVMGIDLNREYILSFGPQHPSTHGVLRLILKMRGEKILSCTPDIGYLHRGVEKILEEKKWFSIVPFLDRLDYLAPLHSEHAYVMAVEDALNISVPKRALYIRTIYDELVRIASHLIAIGSATHDIGMLSPLLYSFEEREKILKIFDMTVGKRMHLAYYLPGGVYNDITDEVIDEINRFVDGMIWYMKTIKNSVLDSRIFKKRTKGVGYISKNMVKEWGITGPNARASGVARDVRKDFPYAAYPYLNFDIVLLNEGDCYTRTLMRFLEINQSIALIKQCLELLPEGPIHIFELVLKKKLNKQIKEAIYSYFFEKGLELPKKVRIYRSVENPRGEMGVFIITEEEQIKPYRLHVRSPSFSHVQLLQSSLTKDIDIPDLTAIIGSLDFIMGDCDR